MDLLQVTTTIAAIALALATLTETRGPQASGIYLIPLTLLFAGFFALGGSLFAIEDLREEATGVRSDWTGLRLLQTPHQALFFAIWAIRLVGLTYLWLLIDMAP
jgi:hypothetical protein